MEDYLPLHCFLDSSKEFHGDFRHRALYHHAQGIFELERRFGVTLVNSAGRVVPVRVIGEQHVIEDLGFIPSLGQWLAAIRPQPWMNRVQQLDLDEKLSESRDAYGNPLATEDDAA